MKKNLLTVISVLCFYATILAQNPVPNPSFENWTGGEPNSWSTTNVTGLITPVTQVTPGNTGTYALKGTVLNFQGQLFPPYVYSGTLGGNGFPVSQSYGYLNLYYKFNPVGGDELNVDVVMISGGAGVGGGSTVITNAASNFTYVSVPIVYSGGIPDSCLIMVIMSNSGGSGNLNLGSYFIVDDISLTGSSGINENLNTAPVIGVTPSPVNTEATINLSLKTGQDLTVSVYDMTGKKVLEQKQGFVASGSHKISMDVSKLNEGLYILRTNSEELFAVRMQVKH